MPRLYSGLLLATFLLFGFSLAAQDCSQDTIAPIPLAINGLILDLEPGSATTVYAAQFDGGSTDNCTEDLAFRMQLLDEGEETAVVDSLVITDEIGPTSLVRFWVGDAAGNWIFCDTYLQIFFCEPGQTTIFNGQRNLEIQLESPDDTIIVSPYDFILEEPSTCGPYENLTIIRGSIPYTDVAFEDFTPTLSFTAADIGTTEVSITGYAPLSFYVFHAYVTVRDENGMGGECELDDAPPLIDKNFRGHAVQLSSDNDPLIVHASELFYLAQDNCTADEDLQYRVARRDDANGEVPPFDTLQFFNDPSNGEITNVIELWVGDEAGNWNFWETYLLTFYEAPQDRLAFGGTAFFDLNANCAQDTDEPGWIGLPVEGYLFQNGAPVGDGEPILSAASGVGNYEFIFNFTGDTLTSVNTQPVFLADTTNLQLLINIPNSLNTGCTSSYLVDVNAHWPLGLSDLNFAMQLEEGCSSPYVDIGVPFLRRCIGESAYTVSYANYGTEPVEDSFIELEFDDDLIVLSSTIPWTIVDGNTYTFPVGTLEPGSFGNFRVNVQVSCDAVLGETHCTEARIFPDILCNEENYNGPSVEVSALCDEEEDEVRFRIENVGVEDMLLASTYIVVEDVIMLEQGDFTLNSGESTVLGFPANGSTYRIEATQVDGHPGFSFPSAAIEGCGTNEAGTFSLGFINLFPQDEFDPNVAIDCQSNIGSYDPNDKTGYPLGVGEEHLILPNVDLDYRIRFQNTGTDTAFTVVIQDTLSPFLDPGSIQPGASSHFYTYQLLAGNVLEFRFPNILLPDSTTNLAGSQGFVQFSVKQQLDNPNGTLIENEASIYFDLNEPIVTNTTQHRIEEIVVLVDVDDLASDGGTISVYPNPSTERVQFRMATYTEGLIRLYTLNGQLVREYNFVGSEAELDLTGLVRGQYVFSLTEASGRQYSGMIILVP